MTLEIRLLGVIELRAAGRRVDIGPAKQRGVFALLASEAGGVVPTDLLEHRTWGDAPPKDARRTLHVYLTRLRRALSPIEGLRLERHGGGYVLNVDAQSVDLHRYRRLGSAARDAADASHAAELWEEAFALWRGEPFAGLDLPGLDRLRHELRAGHDADALDRNDAFLRSGRHAELPSVLSEQIERRPHDERLAGQFMEAAHRSGRTAEALEHYRAFRDRLVEQLGTEPGAPLRGLHRRLLNDDAEPPPPERIAPRQLPVGPAAFTGRTAELAHAVALLTSGNPIVSVDGMAGVGKTAFAVRVARAVSDKFADGQLFVDLRGFSGDLAPLPAHEALGGMLRDLGVAADRMPSPLSDRAALLRSTLADRRVLLVFDNAADAAQVEPMLPGPGDSAALITSRRKLADLPDAEPITLDVLPDGQARELFAAVARRDVDAESAATDAIVALTGRLPLALRLAAARLRSRSAWTIAHLRDRLESERDSEFRSRAGQRLGATFDLSLRALGDGDRATFLLASLIPAHDLSAASVAAATGGPRDQVAEALEELCDLNLLTTAAAGRYQFFDPLRDHASRVAADTLPGDVRGAVAGRVVRWYMDTARAACVAAGIPVPERADRDGADPTASFDDAASALAWLDRERGNLLSVLRSAESSPTPLWILVDSIANYLLFRAEGTALLDIAGVALRQAEALADATAQVTMLTRQSSAAQSLGDRDAMRGFSHSARQRLTADAPPRLRLRVLGQLIIAHRALANVSEAATVAAEALKVYRGLEDGEGSYILQQAAATAFDGGDLAATRELLDEACQRFRRRDSLNLGFALTALMEICSEMGDFDTAERLAAEVREWIDAPGPNLSLAQLHQDLAIYHHARGETDTALGHARQAVELLPKLGMRDVDGAAIRTLAEVGRGVDPDAARHATEAVRLSGESDALTDHIEALRVLAQVTSATAPAERARDLARRHGYRFLEAKALAVLTEVHRADGDRAAARRDGAEALRLLDWCGAKPLRDHVARLIE